MAQNVVEIILKAKDDASKVSKQVSGNLGKDFQKIAKQVGIAMVAAGAAIGAFLYSSVKAAAESEVSWQRVLTTLTPFVQRTKMAKEEMDKLYGTVRDTALKFQDLAGFSDELESESFARLIERTGNLDEATKLLGLANDLARQKQIELGAATDIVMRAFAGNYRELKNYGIEVKEGTKSQDALRIMMDKTGGAAERFGKTYSGQVVIMQEKFDNLKEQIGTQMLPILIEVLNEGIAPVIDALSEWFIKHPDIVKNWFRDLKLGIEIVLPYIKTLGRFYKLYWSDLWQASVKALETVFYWLIRIFDFQKAHPWTSPASLIQSVIGGGQYGIPYVPETGTYKLHAGEAVIPKGQTGFGGFVVNINGGYYLDKEAAEAIGDLIIDKLRDNLRL